MTITAKVILDSISPSSKRLVTMRLRYPRSIHSELMTHRVFSRNSASSRAIPVKKMIEAIRADPFVPVVWGSNKPGMQAGEEINERVRTYGFEPRDGDSWDREDAWLFAMNNAIIMAQAFDAAGYHKQIINRLLEPWMHIEVLVTSTEWSNFFALRLDAAAEPHIQKLATEMSVAMRHSTPTLLEPGTWHLPFVELVERSTYDHGQQITLSVARCAHLSYETTGDGEPITREVADRIYAKLLGSRPIHASPAEHQATPDTFVRSDLAGDGIGFVGGFYMKPELHGNFKGWIQYRKTLAGESA